MTSWGSATLVYIGGSLLLLLAPDASSQAACYESATKRLAEQENIGRKHAESIHFIFAMSHSAARPTRIVAFAIGYFGIVEPSGSVWFCKKNIVIALDDR